MNDLLSVIGRALVERPGKPPNKITEVIKVKTAKYIVDLIQKVSPFKKKSEEENIKLCFYSIFE